MSELFYARCSNRALGIPCFICDDYKPPQDIPPRHPDATPLVEVHKADSGIAHEGALPAPQGDIGEASTGQGGEGSAELRRVAKSGEEPSGGRWVVGSALRYASVKVNSSDRLDPRELGGSLVRRVRATPYGRLFLDGIREQMRWFHEASPYSSTGVDGLGAPPVAAGGSSASDGALELGPKSSAASERRSCSLHVNCGAADSHAVATIDGASGAEHE